MKTNLLLLLFAFLSMSAWGQTKLEMPYDTVKHIRAGKFTRNYFNGTTTYFNTNQTLFNFNKLVQAPLFKIGPDSVPTWPDVRSYISTHTNNYSLPIASVSILGGVKVGTGLSIDGGGVLSATSTSADSSIFKTNYQARQDTTKLHNQIELINNTIKDTISISTIDTTMVNTIDTVNLETMSVSLTAVIDTFDYHVLITKNVKTTDSTLLVSYTDKTLVIQSIYIIVKNITQGGGSIDPIISIGTNAVHDNIVSSYTLSASSVNKIYAISVPTSAIPFTADMFLKINTATDYTTFDINLIIKFFQL